MLLVSSCSCLFLIFWSQVLSRERICRWSSAEMRCSNFLCVINNFVAYWGVTYIKGFTVVFDIQINNRSLRLQSSVRYFGSVSHRISMMTSWRRMLSILLVFVWWIHRSPCWAYLLFIWASVWTNNSVAGEQTRFGAYVSSLYCGSAYFPK